MHDTRERTRVPGTLGVPHPSVYPSIHPSMIPQNVSEYYIRVYTRVRYPSVYPSMIPQNVPKYQSHPTIYFTKHTLSIFGRGKGLSKIITTEPPSKSHPSSNLNSRGQFKKSHRFPPESRWHIKKNKQGTTKKKTRHPNHFFQPLKAALTFLRENYLVLECDSFRSGKKILPQQNHRKKMHG